MDRGRFDKLILSLGNREDIFPGYKPALSGNSPIVLGNGGSSVVYEMLSADEPEKRFALKIIELSDAPESGEKSAGTIRLQRILSSDCRYIVPILETREIIEEGDRYALVLMNKYVPVVSKDKFGNAGINVPELMRTEGVLKFTDHIGEAIVCAHAGNVIHRDIKLENIFWDSENDSYLLGDFGAAKDVSHENAETIVFTNGYGAPELERPVGGDYSFSADIYSFGIVLYLLLNNLCFPGSNDHHPVTELQYSRNFVFPAPACAVNDIAGVIRKMCSYDPDKRYSSVAQAVVAVRGELISGIPGRTEGEYANDLVTETYLTETMTFKETIDKEINDNETAKDKKNRDPEAASKKRIEVGYAALLAFLLTVIFMGLQKNSGQTHEITFLFLPAALFFLGMTQFLKQYRFIVGMAVFVISIVSMIKTGPTWQAFFAIGSALVVYEWFTMSNCFAILAWMIIIQSPAGFIAEFMCEHHLGWIAFAALPVFMYFYFIRFKKVKISQTGRTKT